MAWLHVLFRLVRAAACIMEIEEIDPPAGDGDQWTPQFAHRVSNRDDIKPKGRGGGGCAVQQDPRASSPLPDSSHRKKGSSIALALKRCP